MWQNVVRHMWSYVVCGKSTVKKAKRWCERHGGYHVDRDTQNKCIPIQHYQFNALKGQLHEIFWSGFFS